MEFVITRGSFEIHPLPSQHPDAPEGARGGYLLNVVDEATGIVVRVSMAYANAAQLGHVLVDDTTAHPWQAPEAAPEGQPAAEGFLHVLPEPQEEGEVPAS
jgi:hypothetical protein